MTVKKLFHLIFSKQLKIFWDFELQKNQRKHSAAFHIFAFILRVWKCDKLHSVCLSVCLSVSFIYLSHLKVYLRYGNNQRYVQPVNHSAQNKKMGLGPFLWQFHDSTPFLTVHMLQLNLVGSLPKHSTSHGIVYTHYPYCLSQFEKYDQQSTKHLPLYWDLACQHFDVNICCSC